MTSTTPDQIKSSPASGGLLRRVLAQRELAIFLVVLALAVGLYFASPNFGSQANLIAVLLGLAFNAIVAVGMTILMVSGGFDLSVGSTLALSGAVAGYGMTKLGFNVPMAVLAGLLTGVAVGLVNGLLVTKVNVNPLIATLGVQQVSRGVVLVLTAGLGIANLPDSFNILAQGKLFGLQYPVFFMIVCVIAGEVLLRRSRYFRQSYFVGGNERSARLSGIQVDRVKIVNYIIAGLMASVAGILTTGRMGTASVSAGLGVELQVISAVVIGGASLAGGEGTVLGALLGVALMALIANGLNLLNINPYYQTIIVGAVLVIAVAADSLGKRNRS
jgi:ribose transport system permease protein